MLSHQVSPGTKSVAITYMTWLSPISLPPCNWRWDKSNIQRIHLGCHAINKHIQRWMCGRRPQQTPGHHFQHGWSSSDELFKWHIFNNQNHRPLQVIRQAAVYAMHSCDQHCITQQSFNNHNHPMGSRGKTSGSTCEAQLWPALPHTITFTNSTHNFIHLVNSTQIEDNDSNHFGSFSPPQLSVNKQHTQPQVSLSCLNGIHLEHQKSR